MPATDPFVGSCFEDGTLKIFALATSDDATGDVAPDEKWGKLIKQADVATISGHVYDLSSDTPDTAIITLTVMASDFYDTLQTSGIFKNLRYGGNFLLAIPSTAFPESDHVYLIEIYVTTVQGAKFFGQWKETAVGVRSS